MNREEKGVRGACARVCRMSLINENVELKEGCEIEFVDRFCDKKR